MKSAQKAGILLVEEPGHWRVGSTLDGLSDERIPCDQWDALAAAINRIANASDMSRRVVLAVASESVFFALLSEEQASKIKSDQGLRYILESLLPVDSDGIVADWLERGRKPVAAYTSAICMEIEHVAALVDFLERHAFPVISIAPTALIAHEGALSRGFIPKGSICVLHDTEELVAADPDGRVVAWRNATLSNEALANEQRLIAESIASESLPPIFVLGSEPDATSTQLEQAKFVPQVNATELVRQQAHQYIAGKAEPAYELRRNQLAAADPWRAIRSPIVRLQVTAAIALVVLSLSMLWRGSTLRNLSTQNQARQVEVYKEIFPGQRVPTTMVSRLRSQRARIVANKKQSIAPETHPSAVTMLLNLLQCLPQDVEFAVNSIRFSDGDLTLEMKVDSQVDAGRVAASMVGSKFEVQPPSTVLTQDDRLLVGIRGKYEK